MPSILALALAAIGFLASALSGTVAATAPPVASYQRDVHHPEINAMAFEEEIPHLGPGRWNPDMLLAAVVPLLAAVAVSVYVILFW